MRIPHLGLSACLVVFAPALVLAKDPPPSFLPQLQQELVGRSHRTRALIGTMVAQRSPNLGRTVFKRVDTELYPGGAVRYLCSKGEYAADGSPLVAMGMLFNKAFYIEPSQASGLSIGATVQVSAIELEKDRIEVTLDALGVAPYAKIRLMVGQQYLQRETYDSVMALLSKALVVESYEARRALLEKYGSAKARLSQQRQAFANGRGTASERLQAADTLLSALKETESISRQLGTGDDATLSQEILSTEQAAATLRPAAKAERLAVVTQQTQEIRQELDATLARLKVTPREQDVQAAEALLARQSTAFQQRTEIGEPVTEAERGQATVDQGVVTKAKTQIEAQRAAAERAQRLAGLDAEFATLAPKVAAAKKAYAQAFGTPEQPAEGRRLLVTLEQLQKNRAAAAQAGSLRASSEAADAAKEIQRLRATLR